MNNKILYYLLAASFFVFVAAPLVAQEQEAEDPFADYSYLWENTKKKKKKKDKKAGKVDQPQAVVDTLVAEPASVADTLTLPTQPLDSITSNRQSAGAH